MRLQNTAAKDDAEGYYAGRILCDVLPIISQLKEFDAPAASKELKEAKAHNILGSNYMFCQANLTRRFSSPCCGIGICRTTCWL
jgi:hypothetical protein